MSISPSTVRDTLEIRKIPKHLNNISLLNRHFSQFGTITNIQVGYANDPEAALIQFQNHSEAAAAYKSTDAIFDNRFIKLFWHCKDQSNNNTQNSAFPDSNPKDLSAAEQANSSEVSSKDIQSQKVSAEKGPERSVIYSGRNLCRTVFNPVSLPKKCDNSHTIMSSLGRQKEERKMAYLQDSLNRKLELHKKKQEFLEAQIENQKVILAKLGTVKNKKEKVFLKQTLDSLGTRIKCLSDDVKKSSEELKSFLKLCNMKSVSTKSEAEKELLDAELDLYKLVRKGDDTAELLSKVHELKQKAKAFGILEPSASHDVASKTKHVGGLPQFSMKSGNSSSALLKIDNRPKTLLVSDFQDKDALAKHFMAFGNVQKVEENKLGFTVTFSTRKAAEMALLNGSKLGEENLSLSWFQEDQQSVSIDVKDTSDSKEKMDTMHFVDGDEDDEEEEDSEARSWRR